MDNGIAIIIIIMLVLIALLLVTSVTTFIFAILTIKAKKELQRAADDAERARLTAKVKTRETVLGACAAALAMLLALLLAEKILL
ncbi:MAG: hypothetical protein IKH27_04155 [Oscillospiraceae bacterium]|nr:hypothetical protein [Oscillospiraceae bacterium]